MPSESKVKTRALQLEGPDADPSDGLLSGESLIEGHGTEWRWTVDVMMMDPPNEFALRLTDEQGDSVELHYQWASDSNETGCGVLTCLPPFESSDFFRQFGGWKVLFGGLVTGLSGLDSRWKTNSMGETRWEYWLRCLELYHYGSGDTEWMFGLGTDNPDVWHGQEGDGWRDASHPAFAASSAVESLYEYWEPELELSDTPINPLNELQGKLEDIANLGYWSHPGWISGWYPEKLL